MMYDQTQSFLGKIFSAVLTLLWIGLVLAASPLILSLLFYELCSKRLKQLFKRR